MIWVIFLILTCFSHVAFRKLYNMEIHCFIFCKWIQNYPFSIHKFNHLPIEGHFSCFQCGAVMNKATINIHVKKKTFCSLIGMMKRYKTYKVPE